MNAIRLLVALGAFALATPAVAAEAPPAPAPAPRADPEVAAAVKKM